ANNANYDIVKAGMIDRPGNGFVGTLIEIQPEDTWGARVLEVSDDNRVFGSAIYVAASAPGYLGYVSIKVSKNTAFQEVHFAGDKMLHRSAHPRFYDFKAGSSIQKG